MAGMTRRVFIVGGLATALATTLKADNTELPIICHRQQYLDELVKREPSPYVGKVIYDHYGSLIEKADYLHFRKLFDDPQSLNSMLKYSDDPEVKGGFTEEEIKFFHELRELLQDIVLFSIFKFKKLQTLGTDDELARTSYYPPDFGKGAKSDIYFLKTL